MAGKARVVWRAQLNNTVAARLRPDFYGPLLVKSVVWFEQETDCRNILTRNEQVTFQKTLPFFLPPVSAKPFHNDILEVDEGEFFRCEL